MKANSDRASADEWLISFLRGVTRWASTGPATAPPGEKPDGRGCLNPISLLKIVVFLLMIVLCPLFFLPFLVVRIARDGRSSLKYSSRVEVTSGEAARWSYSPLAPVTDKRDVQGALDSIRHYDQGFQASRLSRWAVAASELIWQSIVRGDPTMTRTFMSSGLFRNHCALLELRAQADVIGQGTWQVTDVTVADVVITALFEQVRVRLQCRGSCWERHGPTDLTLRGGPDETTWSEDLTFGRLAGARTPDSGGLPDGRCPSCGAALDLDPDGACRYCHGIVTAGRHDWVLTSWRRDPW
jgi:hypothetical protein